jgi:P27 family predicted phage terminase small subunit
VSRRLLARADTAAVERYVRACELARRARAEHAAQGAPLTSAGSTGQPVLHPLLRIIEHAEAAAARYGAELLLTPVSRLRSAAPDPAPAARASELPGLSVIRGEKAS